MHTLVAVCSLDGDVNTDNDSRSVEVEVVETVANTMSVATLGGSSANLFWGVWQATVTFGVKDGNLQPVENATVSGTFSDGSTLFECTTNAAGRCSVEGWQWWLNCLTFTISDVVHATLEYDPAFDDDHEPDLFGTNITVCRP
jgi:hypothetical protein